MGLFGTSKRNSTNSKGSDRQSSIASNREIESQNNMSQSSSSRAPPPRRIPLPRSVTTDHVTPPPIQQGEIDAFALQIEDLSRCTDNPALFEILVSDIDRNRLTQMTMILAEKGEYPTMARVMEISDALDRLIRGQVDEAHRRQRLSLRGTIDNDLSLEDFIKEADEVNKKDTMTAAELRSKIQMFDQCFSDFQNEPFDQLVALSERVEVMRKRLRGMIAPQQTNNASPPPSEPGEPWESFPSTVESQPRGDLNINEQQESVEVAEDALNNNEQQEPVEAVDDALVIPPPPVVEPPLLETTTTPPEPSVVWETFGGPVITMDEAGITSDLKSGQVISIEEAGITADLKLVRGSFNAWNSVKLQKKQRDLTATQARSLTRQTLTAWIELARTQLSEREHILAEHFTFKRRRQLRLVVSEWISLSDSATHTRYMETYKLSQMLPTWRVFTHRRVTMRHRLSTMFRLWSQHARSRKDLESQIHGQYTLQSLGPVLSSWLSETSKTRNMIFTLQTDTRERRLALCFRNWVELTKSCSVINTDSPSERSREWIAFSFMQRRIENYLRRILSEWHQECQRNHTSSPLRGLGILATEHKDAPTSPEAWLEELPDGVDQTVDDSQASIPESVEHYIIHDSPAVHSAIDIRVRTEEIIAKAQVFLSQRHLRTFTPAPLKNVGGQHFCDSKLESACADESTYFSWFDKKWAYEQKLWHL